MSICTTIVGGDFHTKNFSESFQIDKSYHIPVSLNFASDLLYTVHNYYKRKK